MRAMILIDALSAIYLSEHRSRRCCKELVAACGLASIFCFSGECTAFLTVEALLADASTRDGRWRKSQDLYRHSGGITTSRCHLIVFHIFS